MTMADVWSSLTTKWAVNYDDSEPRTTAVVGIGHHHTASPNLLVCLQQFYPGGRTVTPNYFITPTDIYGIVPENRRAYTSADRTFDNGSITYEILNSEAGPFWSFDPRTLENVKKLDADIMRRYGIRPAHAFPGFWEHKNVYQWTGRGYATACAGPSFHIYDVINGAVYYYNNPTGGDEFDMASLEDLSRIVGASQNNVLAAVRREQRFRKVSNKDRSINIIGRPGKVLRLANDGRSADAQLAQIGTFNPLILNLEEVGGSLPQLDNTEILTLMDVWDPGVDHGFGTFVQNVFELTEGPTLMIRSDSKAYPYGSRQQVWANLNPVILLYKNVRVEYLKKPNVAVLVDGREVALTQTEVDRANAQKPSGQTWR